MRRRIRGAIVGVSAIILIALEVPLAIVVYRSALSTEVVEMQARAATALAEIDLPLDQAQIEKVALEADVPRGFAVYDLDGSLVAGRGPAVADGPVREALGGAPASSRQGAIVVATPVLDNGTESIHGALRVSESLTGARHRAQVVWLGMAAAGLIALGLAWLLATRLARTLSEPLTDLADRAERLGEAGALEPGRASGIPEIDSLAEVLASRGRAVSEALRRERQMGTDLSHQLRTPVTALRLKLEGMPAAADAGAMADLARIEATIDHLMALARDAVPAAEPLALDPTVAAAVERWRPTVEARGRAIQGPAASGAVVRVHAAAVAEVLGVLVDNSLAHGAGTISVRVRPTQGGVAIDVADEGDGVSLLDGDRIFERGVSRSGTGIGLAVARAVAEAEGARLELTGQQPTVFTLLLLDPVASR